MSSDDVDLAFVCEDVAKEFVKSDKRFVILGSSIVNADVVVSKGNIVKKVAVSDNREYQIKLAYDAFGKNIEIVKLYHTALAYSLENDDIDAIVTSKIKALNLNAKIINPKKDYVSYVIIANKNLIDTKKLSDFLNSYNKAINYLNNSNNFIDFAKRGGQIKNISRKERVLWNMHKIKLMLIS